MTLYVYVLVEHYHYESSDIIGVFGVLEDAKSQALVRVGGRQDYKYKENEVDGTWDWDSCTHSYEISRWEIK